MPFSISLSPSHDKPYYWEDKKGNEIVITRPPDDYKINIDSHDLTVGKWYDLKFPGPKLEFSDSDM